MTLSQWLGEENQLGIDIMKSKYLFSEGDQMESFDDWVERISGGDEQVKDLILSKKFLFGGRILANRGLPERGYRLSYSNCYCTAPPSDCLESIFETATKMARTYSYGGGVGVDLSGLSPAGAKVRNAAKESTGAVSFMDLYSMVTELISQRGRRGALMISMSCEHPDIEEFIDVKKNLDKVTKANISVRMTDAFMRAAEEGSDVTLSFTREETGETLERTVNARQVLYHLAENNWSVAEPGCLFWDRVENWNLLSNTKDFHFAGTNPCAEEPLPAGGSCLLGSINLSAFVKDGVFDEEDFRRTVSIAIRALDTVLDEGLPLHPLEEQRESVRDWRQVGLGQMGLADCLIRMGVRYGSAESLAFIDRIGRIMINEALQESARLASVKGAYPKYDAQAVLSTPFFLHNATEETRELVERYGLCNSQLLTIAPTGTISTMLGISGGVEPVFANYYTRKTETLKGHDEYYKVYTPIVKEYMEEHSLTDDADLPEWFVTAADLDYKERIQVQATWQEHIDAAISSTINVPNEFTVEQVFDLYMEAWKKGLKGVTLFRDGCLRMGILTTGKDKKEETKELARGQVLPVSDSLIGLKRSITSGCGSLHVEAFFTRDTGELMEIFLSKGSTGGCNSFMVGLSRMISVAARGGIPMEDIVDQLHSTISCPSFTVRTATKHDTSRGSSCPNAIGYALIEMREEIRELLHLLPEEVKGGEKGAPAGNAGKGNENGNGKGSSSSAEEFFHSLTAGDVSCPACGNRELNYTNGCVTCPECGWAHCS